MRFRPALIVLGAILALLAATFLPFPSAGKTGLPIRPFDLLAGARVPPPRPPYFREPIIRALRIAQSLPVTRRPLKIPNVPEAAGQAVIQPIEAAAEGALDAFFLALEERIRDARNVRIAYFGDSIVEGDLITQDLRTSFQKAFGGGGAGFLPIASEVAPFRITVGQDFSLGWKTVSLLHRKRDAAVGISGFVYLPAEPEAWTEYRAPAKRPLLKEFRKLRVLYGPTEEPAVLEWTADGGEPQEIALDPGTGLREAVIEPDPPAAKIRLVFRASGVLPVYGAIWDNADGVQVDNFAVRGNSGLPLREIPVNVLRDFDARLRYSLIVLHFGTNVASAETTDYGWYGQGMIETVRHFREAFPDASILLVGVGDRSIKEGLDFVTLPGLPDLVEVQRHAAAKSDAAFFDLYGAMGGMNSMVAWVNHDPPLAALDYTHLSGAGSRRVAGFLYNALLARFRAFEAGRAR
ncbi:MAG: GDSL-type esterase/lipase family protein [Acidobacteriota bacterium]|nr:GDSL-type esterase/lipase family protein [Acidobacteriota bacterium]